MRPLFIKYAARLIGVVGLGFKIEWHLSRTFPYSHCPFKESALRAFAVVPSCAKYDVALQLHRRVVVVLRPNAVVQIRESSGLCVGALQRKFTVAALEHRRDIAATQRCVIFVVGISLIVCPEPVLANDRVSKQNEHIWYYQDRPGIN